MERRGGTVEFCCANLSFILFDILSQLRGCQVPFCRCAIDKLFAVSILLDEATPFFEVYLRLRGTPGSSLRHDMTSGGRGPNLRFTLSIWHQST